MIHHESLAPIELMPLPHLCAAELLATILRDKSAVAVALIVSANTEKMLLDNVLIMDPGAPELGDQTTLIL
jgi:hypothetical protein